jgi:hypothetical protein
MKEIDYGLGTAVGVVMLEIQSGDDSPMLKNCRCRVFILWRVANARCSFQRIRPGGRRTFGRFSCGKVFGIHVIRHSRSLV